MSAISAMFSIPIAVGLPSVGTAPDFSVRYMPKEGSAMTFKLKGDMDIQGSQATLESTVVQKVLKVDSDGTYSVQSNTVLGKVIFSGQEMEMPKNSAVTVYKPTGEVVSMTGTQVDATSMRSQALMMLKRPANNVKIGDTWAVDTKADSATSRPALRGTFKLDSEETIGVYHTLKIVGNISEVDVPLAGSSNSTFWIDEADGSIVKFDGKYVNVLFPGAPTPLSGSLTMTRQDK